MRLSKHSFNTILLCMPRLPLQQLEPGKRCRVQEIYRASYPRYLRQIIMGKIQTLISEFLLLDLPIQQEHKNLFYALLLSIYLITILGKLLLLILLHLDSYFHTPMYLFLSNMSFSYLCSSSVTMPKLLQNMQSQIPSIPYASCMTEIYFFLFFGNLMSFLFMAMAYDCYVAILFPLQHPHELKFCLSLVVLFWVLTMFYSFLYLLLIHRLSLSADNVIPHLSCEISTLLKLACTYTHVNELMLFIIGGVVFIPVLLILLSYTRNMSSILEVPSAQSICKAFSTCGSHIFVVLLFYGTVIGLYLCPSANNSTVKDTVMALKYTFVTLMLNSFIYSLRNRVMKEAPGRALYKKKIPFHV
ncbi:olfactory receptor 1468-like [Sciurus carolinensis]|uniref:olfactory receptor 1468-like n=1 Tax=Sciurus carolinensis TaxID=30640 RepID=UPI001FB526BB|nr:olfactory receptor 1468-like [Sciurus carolinensis]